ncbi:APC family permease [Acidicapsa ligni]|uniref:APC family permease n=1 Tax=Acidicapsa ligni TaxID=542300 RepID=UPI0021E01065|nr:APC family permease [Acidicapsa ligni]
MASPNLWNLLLGRPLATSEERAEQIGPLAGIPIFGLDALSSAAYGPEAALTLLIPLGLLGVKEIVPISLAILGLLILIFFSYRQTIDAYPHGGGSFTVASENLGDGAGLLAAAALMIDYVLTAAVGISAGVGALISAVPSLQPYTLVLCLGILAILTLVNMRGVHDTGAIFMVPTYLFLITLLIVIGVGGWHVLMSGGHPAPLTPLPVPAPATEMLSLWLLLKVFSSGCAAMTGVEAVSNGVMAFRDPACKNAKTTLTIIIAFLFVLLLGIALLCRAYGVAATDPTGPHYESVLSMLTRAVMGHGWFYYVTIGAILLVLALSANTAFADFPRLTRAIALKDYLPHIFLVRGRRLLYSWGIFVLVALTALLLIIFGGVTDKLIPLYAIGAFLAFTLSQAGMVMHWKRQGGARFRGFVNGLGAVATGITAIVVLVTKFASGAWITALLIPAMILVMYTVRRHYDSVAKQTELDTPLVSAMVQEPIVVMPIDRWSRITERAVSFALSLSSDVRCVHVQSGEEPDEISKSWQRLVVDPLHIACKPVPKLVVLMSPYRYILQPLVDYVLSVAPKDDSRKICVLVPELMVRHWWENLMHNRRADILKVLLMMRGNHNIVVINIPWYLEREIDRKKPAA